MKKGGKMDWERKETLDEVTSLVKSAAIKAGRRLLKIQPTAKRLDAFDKDFSTEADVEAEEIIFQVLRKKYPDIPLYSEETGGVMLKSGPLWVIDPLDGTVNHFHQDECWGVSIALVVDGAPKVGVVYLPAKNQLFSAHAATPRAKLEGIKPKKTGAATVGKYRNLTLSQVWVDWGKVSETFAPDLMKYLRKYTLYPQLRICCTNGMMAVASGRIAGYIYQPDPFDAAASLLIVEKAGGRVTNTNGERWLPFDGGIVVATNGVIHDELLDLLRKSNLVHA